MNFILLFIFLLIIIIVPVYVTQKDCKVSEWSEYSKCDADCDGGKQVRTRTITRKALAGGIECPILKEEKKCNEQVCNIDCVVSEWPSYGVCSKSCDGGTRVRTRQILKQKKGTGKECPILEETQKCNEQECDVDCVVSEWSAYSICDKECGDGTNKRTRQILRPKKGNGLACPVNLEEIEKCNLKDCDVDCKLSDWSEFSKCDKDCGDGKKTSTRYIVTPNKGNGKACDPTLVKTETCNLKDCDANCELSEWSPWSTCDATCGDGKETSTRYVTKPKKGNGLPCEPNLVKTRSCKLKDCPVDCKLSEWSNWTGCDKVCGEGIDKKTRTIITMNQGTGIPCSALGSLVETKTCKLKECDVDCKLSEFSNWSTCNAKCAGGTQKRTRTVLIPKKANGLDCLPLEETQKCNELECVCGVNEFGYNKLCYPKCSVGYINKDDKCIEQCRPNYTDSGTTCIAPKPPLDKGIAYLRDNLSTSCIAGYTANGKYCVRTDYNYLKDVKDNKSIDRSQ
jgi:hypothetical protein